MFKPTRAQSMLKSKFYRAVGTNPLLSDVESMSINKIESLTKSKKIREWMQNDEFEAWFRDSNHIEDLMEADLELGMERLREMFMLPYGEGVKPSEVLKGVEMLLKFTGREPKKDKGDKDMDIPDDQLDKMIERELADQAKIVKVV